MTLHSRLGRLERHEAVLRCAGLDRPCTCHPPIVDHVLGDGTPEPVAPTGTHCPACGGRYGPIRMIVALLPPEKESEP